MPQIANSADIVVFGRSQCSRQHAFEAMLHCGLSNDDATNQAAALSLVGEPLDGPVSFYDPDQERDDHGRWGSSGAGGAADKKDKAVGDWVVHPKTGHRGVVDHVYSDSDVPKKENGRLIQVDYGNHKENHREHSLGHSADQESKWVDNPTEKPTGKSKAKGDDYDHDKMLRHVESDQFLKFAWGRFLKEHADASDHVKANYLKAMYNSYVADNSAAKKEYDKQKVDGGKAGPTRKERLEKARAAGKSVLRTETGYKEYDKHGTTHYDHDGRITGFEPNKYAKPNAGKRK